MAVYTYTGPNGVVQRTRTYNGDMAGPTIRIKPGDTLTVTLTNNLPAEPVSTDSLHNQFRAISVTNLHTHGLHISGEAPGDSIFTEVAASSAYTYTYVIPSDHMGGTFWYHPHHHGSTAIHAGGGAAGVIIVEDAAGTVPSQVSSMTEVILMMSHLNMAELTTISQEYETNCQGLGGSAADCDDDVWANGPTSGTQIDSVLVNGMYQPVITLSANKWYRFRTVFASVDGIIMPTLTGCTIGLIAKDGIYLHTAPRTITQGYMGPGSRADWAVSCPAGSYTLASGARRREMQGGKMAGGGDGNDQITQTLATVTVTDQGDTATTLSTFSVTRPCYLVDLTAQTASSTVSIGLG